MSYTFCVIMILCLSIGAFAQSIKDTLRVEWKTTDPRCDQIFIDGEDIRIIRDNNFVIMVSGVRDKDFVAFDVSVFNESDRRIVVDPANSAFVTWKNRQQQLGDIVKRLEPEKIASKYRTRTAWANALRAFGAGMATNQTTTYGTASGNATVNDRSGYAGSVYYSGTTTTTTTTPNYEVRRQVAQRNAEANAEASSKGNFVLQTALRANTLFPKGDVRGTVFYERKKAEVGSFVILVDNVRYVFGFRLD